METRVPENISREEKETLMLYRISKQRSCPILSSRDQQLPKPSPVGGSKGIKRTRA